MEASARDKVREYGVPGTYDEATEECVSGPDPGYGGKHLSADVEGLTLLKEKDGDGYLLASSQGDDTFAAYDRELGDDNEYEGGFRVTAASATLDSAEESDGAAVLNEPLGSKYPKGLLVVQDGDDKPGSRAGTPRTSSSSTSDACSTPSTTDRNPLGREGPSAPTGCPTTPPSRLPRDVRGRRRPPVPPFR